jgi:hypothetical protein
VRAGEYRFVGVSNTEAGFREYVGNMVLPFPVLAVNAKQLGRPAELAFLKQLGVTPQLIVVEPGGMVRKAWTGALTPQTQDEVERFFGLTLPGLISVP